MTSSIKTYKGVSYIVYWRKPLGHYNGYVRLPETHRFLEYIDKTDNVIGKKLYIGYNLMDIDCHGGLTFSQRVTKDNVGKFPQGFTEGAWIGWDYAHSGDKVSFEGMSEDYKEFTKDYKAWTEKEVEEECKNVIDQLLK